MKKFVLPLAVLIILCAFLIFETRRTSSARNPFKTETMPEDPCPGIIKAAHELAAMLARCEQDGECVMYVGDMAINVNNKILWAEHEPRGLAICQILLPHSSNYAAKCVNKQCVAIKKS